MPSPIPTVDALTPDWFTDLLRRNDVLDDSRSVASATLAPFGEGESIDDWSEAMRMIAMGSLASTRGWIFSCSEAK